MTKFYTYIAYNSHNMLQSIGVTNNLQRRFKLLNIKCNESKKGNCKLVFYEEFDESVKATEREKVLLDLHESIINELVAGTNPMFINLLLSNNH